MKFKTIAKRCFAKVPLVFAGAALLQAPLVNALELIHKPGFPVGSAEAGASLDRNGRYILLGADQEGTRDPNTFNPRGLSARNGALHIMVEGYDKALRSFGYVNTPERFMSNLGYIPSSGNSVQMFLGSNVAMSDRWIVSSMNWWGDSSRDTKPALFIVDRGENEGLGPSCPKVNELYDCYGIIEPVPMPDDNMEIRREPAFDLAASTKHIAYVGRSTNPENFGKAIVQVLTYNDEASSWDLTKEAKFNAPSGARFSIDIEDDYFVVGVSGTSDNPKSGTIYSAHWDFNLNGWSGIGTSTYHSNDNFFAQDIAIDNRKNLMIAGGHGNEGRVYFYNLQYQSGHLPKATPQTVFNTNFGVSKVALSGSMALAYSTNATGMHHQVLAYNGERVFQNASSWTSWREYGELDFDAVNQLPEPGIDTSDGFFPSDMAIGYGGVSFGWRGVGHANNGNPITLVGGIVNEDFSNLYRSSKDPTGKFYLNLANGPVVLDEGNALLPSNSFDRGPHANSNGWFHQDWSAYARTYMKASWLVNVPTSRNYQVCVKYLSLNGDDQQMVLMADGGAFSLFTGLSYTGLWNFGTQCHDEYLEAGEMQFSIVSWAQSVGFDQITIQ